MAIEALEKPNYSLSAAPTFFLGSNHPIIESNAGSQSGYTNLPWSRATSGRESLVYNAKRRITPLRAVAFLAAIVPIAVILNCLRNLHKNSTQNRRILAAGGNCPEENDENEPLPPLPPPLPLPPYPLPPYYSMSPDDIAKAVLENHLPPPTTPPADLEGRMNLEMKGIELTIEGEEGMKHGHKTERHRHRRATECVRGNIKILKIMVTMNNYPSYYKATTYIVRRGAIIFCEQAIHDDDDLTVNYVENDENSMVEND